MINKGNCKENKYTFNLGDLCTAVPVEKSLVDSFYTEEHDQTDGTKSVSFHDPIRMLFNQERLNQLGTAAVQRWLETLSQSKTSPLNDMRQHCDDNMLMELIKSRHIQSMSELQAYAKYCQANVDEFKSEVQKYVALKQAEEAKKNATDSTPPVQSSDKTE